MFAITRVAGLLMIFALAACDVNNNVSNSIEVAKGSSRATLSNNVVYFPDGGGVEFAKPFVNELEGKGWRYKEFVLDNDWDVLSSALKKSMLQQDYEILGGIDLQGFQDSMSFAKKGSSRKVNYRMKVINSVTGERILMRLSWNI